MDSKANWFVRAMIVVVCLFLATGLAYRFVALEPKGELSYGVLVVILVLVTLVLSESFNNFSIGSIFTLSREVKKKGAEVSELKVENRELRNQLISIATNVSQKQTSTNIVGLPQDIARMFSVTRAEADEVEEKQAVEKQIEEKAVQKAMEGGPETTAPANEETSVPGDLGGSAVRPSRERRRLNFRALEEVAIAKFVKANDLEQFPVLREAKIAAQIEVLDPISTSTPIFDAYLSSFDAEIFIECRPSQRYTLGLFRERLYVMLTKLNYYRALKKANVFLALVFVRLPNEDPLSVGQVARFSSEFQPAVASGLLKILEVSLNEDEATAVYETT